MNKEQLLSEIREKYLEFTQLLSRTPADRMGTHPGPTPKWTVKDLIAHLAYWQHPTLDRAAGRNLSSSWGDIAAINAQLLQQSTARSTEEILTDFSESCERVIHEISAFTEDQLQNESPWKDGKTLVDHLADDTFIHFGEHLPSFRLWVSRL